MNMVCMRARSSPRLLLRGAGSGGWGGGGVHPPPQWAEFLDAQKAPKKIFGLN